MLTSTTPHHLPASPTKTDPDTETDEDCAIKIQQKVHRHHHHAGPHTHSKLKSSLCRNYARSGYCPYGAKCQFAHGP